MEFEKNILQNDRGKFRKTAIFLNGNWREYLHQV